MEISFILVSFLCKWPVSMYIGQFPMYIGQFLCKLVRFLCKLASYLIANTFSADDLYRKASECEIKRPMRVGKNEAGGPEKQVILFVWPYACFSCGRSHNILL